MIACTLTLLTTTASSPTTLVLGGLDPVDLVQGRQIQGFPAYTAPYLRYRYRFSTPENQRTFLQNPEKYAVQNGGACGKMGALTGKGGPERFAVAKGQIFLFASDGCRTTFLANQPSYFKSVPLAPTANSAEQSKAQAIWQTARRAHGLAPGEKPPVIQTIVETPYVSNGKNLVWKARTVQAGPDTFADYWGELSDPGFFAAHKGRFLEGDREGHYPMAHGERRALRAQFLRRPLGILHLSPKDIVAPYAANGKKGFTAAPNGIVAHILLDPKTNRIAEIHFTDHHAGPVASVQRRYSNYEKVGKLWLPKTTQTKIDDHDWGTPSTITRFETNIPLPDFIQSI